MGCPPSPPVRHHTVGSRVRVRFDTGRWYGGEITEIDEENGTQNVQLDDGSQERYPLKADNVVLEEEGDAKKGAVEG